MSRLLDTIDRPQDLHALSEDQLSQVAQEVRELLIDTVGEIGGHFGANLGTCEIAVALHSLLDSPTDKILWDVGHQAYPHKVLTGRLIGASVECVLLLAGTPDPSPTLIEFRAFAAELGVLFQIVDDILDVTGTDAALGKPRGSDERHGKRTYVSSHGLEGARELAAESHRNALAALRRAPGDGGAAELEQITDFIATRTS